MSAPTARQPRAGGPLVWTAARRRDDGDGSRGPGLTAPVLVLPRGRGAAVPGPAGRSTAASGWDALTPRELQVVELVTLGATNQQAARRLHVSPHTVNAHLRHVFAKLGVSSRVELTRVAVARERG